MNGNGKVKGMTFGEYCSDRKYSKTSERALQYCGTTALDNDKEDALKYITKSKQAFTYCKKINNNPEIRKYITKPTHAIRFCSEVDDDPEVRKYITTSASAVDYCLNVNDDPEIRKYITEIKGVVTYTHFMARRGVFNMGTNKLLNGIFIRVQIDHFLRYNRYLSDDDGYRIAIVLLSCDHVVNDFERTDEEIENCRVQHIEEMLND